MGEKVHVCEDNNMDGLYWSFLIRRDDVSKSGNATRFISKCPFDLDIKHHIEQLLTDVINIAIDDYTIRNFAKLKQIARNVYEKACKDNRVPVIKHLNIIGDAEGLRVIIYLGVGYGIDFTWTPFNGHKDTTINWYKRSGPTWMRNTMKTIIDQVDNPQWT